MKWLASLLRAKSKTPAIKHRGRHDERLHQLFREQLRHLVCLRSVRLRGDLHMGGQMMTAASITLYAAAVFMSQVYGVLVERSSLLAEGLAKQTARTATSPCLMISLSLFAAAASLQVFA